MSGKSTDHLAPAADWGSGVTRRAIRLRGAKGEVEAALEDMRHAMICTLHHDGQVVTGIETDFRRYTLQLCPEARGPLQALVGMPIATTTADFFANGRARQNCTHMLDLAWLAMRHAARDVGEWLYEVTIPDVVSGPIRGTLARNGTIVQDWLVDAETIIEPSALAGKSPSGGLIRWLAIESGLPDLVVEECLVLQKGFFMVGARQFKLPEGVLPDAFSKAVTGACFGYGADRITEAIGQSGMERDFSATPEKLLRFE